MKRRLETLTNRRIRRGSAVERRLNRPSPEPEAGERRLITPLAGTRAGADAEPGRPHRVADSTPANGEPARSAGGGRIEPIPNEPAPEGSPLRRSGRTTAPAAGPSPAPAGGPGVSENAPLTPPLTALSPLSRAQAPDRGHVPCRLAARIGADGYGLGAGGEAAHRVAYREAHGPIPDGHDVHHQCGRRPCVEPTHLIALSRREHLIYHVWPALHQWRAERRNRQPHLRSTP